MHAGQQRHNIIRHFFCSRIKNGSLEIKLGLPFMVVDLAYTFQMICFRGTLVFELNPKCGM